MAKPIAMVIWDRCKPSECEGGRCLAVAECPQKVLKQETLGEPPYALGPCKGCALCVTACPLGAIKLG